MCCGLLKPTDVLLGQRGRYSLRFVCVILGCGPTVRIGSRSMLARAARMLRHVYGSLWCIVGVAYEVCWKDVCIPKNVTEIVRQKVITAPSLAAAKAFWRGGYPSMRI